VTPTDPWPGRVRPFGLSWDRSNPLTGGAAIATPIRVLIAKVGLDGHDRGAKVVARALRDGGMDVIYTGLHRTPEEVVAAAVQEDVDVLGVSILSGAHLTLLPRIVELLRASDAADVLLVAGGVIPDEDIPGLRDSGVAEIFLQETPPAALVARIRELVDRPGRLSPSGARSPSVVRS
jgi:methylmalonyl-CoA mutase C-terminal domain/subunit